MEWTEETISRLKELWAEGHSTAEIGRRLSITKNAVVGKAHRLGLPARPSPIRRNSEKKPTPTPAGENTAEKPKMAKVESTEARPAVQPVPEQPPVQEKETVSAAKVIKEEKTAPPLPRASQPKPEKPEPAPRATARPPKPVISRMPDPEPKKRRGPSCCWPNGDPGTPGFHFCGAVPLPGKPYCAEHAQIAYVKLRDRRDSSN